MSYHFPKPKPGSLLIAAVAVVGLGGAALLSLAPHHTSPLATVFRPAAKSGSPAPKSSPASPEATSATQDGTGSASSTPEASNVPAVAGAATQAPKPAQTAITKPSATTAPQSTPSPSTVTLVLSILGHDSSYKVKLLPGADACTVLEEAKTEGKISSLNIDYSYLQTLHSAYVREINGYENNWTVKVNGVSPLGCSLAKPQINDNVTWRYQ